MKLAKGTDLVVMTNFYARIEKRGNNLHLVKALKDAGHTVVVVTNFPYLKGTTRWADAVVCNFSGSPDSIRAAADFLRGAFKQNKKTKMPIDLSAEKGLPETGSGAGRQADDEDEAVRVGGKVLRRVSK